MLKPRAGYQFAYYLQEERDPTRWCFFVFIFIYRIGKVKPELSFCYILMLPMFVIRSE